MKRLALFSSYISEKYSHLPEYILYYLEKIRPHVDTLVFIYNEDFNLTENAKLLALVDDIMPVKNEGYDFGMWQKGLKKHNAQDYDELCLLNDSCVCIGDFDVYFNWHNNQLDPITGLTSSLVLTRHLQSYFLCIKTNAIPVVVSWLSKQNFASLNYLEVIICGEIGLSLITQFQDLKINALVNSKQVGNFANYQPGALVELGLPLVKKKALLYDYDKNLELFKQNEPVTFVTELIQQKREFSLEQCHSLFDWMPNYVLNQTIYTGKTK